jgi:hypothetical protein
MTVTYETRQGVMHKGQKVTPFFVDIALIDII